MPTGTAYWYSTIVQPPRLLVQYQFTAPFLKNEETHIGRVSFCSPLS